MSLPRLTIREVSKRFGATQALDGVSFDVLPGEVHGLLGENGAGKSTLMKILSGAHTADAGEIVLDGKAVKLTNPAQARRLGIAMIYQELNLAPDLSVEENILLGEEPRRFGIVNGTVRRARALEVMRRLHCEHLRLEEPVGNLSVAHQQLVEIGRALLLEPRVLIMDEPTSSLTQSDTENLFRVIRSLKERGVSVIYISHFLEECQEICDRYTVMRDGAVTGQGDMAKDSLDDIIRAMVGREMAAIYQVPAHAATGEALRLAGVTGVEKPTSVTLNLQEGEIFGLFGLVGAGRSETLRAVFGLDTLAAGEVEVFGREMGKGSPRDKLRAGMGLLSEDRKEEGLLLNRSVADNLTLSHFGSVAVGGIVNDRRQREEASRWIDELSIKTRGPGQAIGELSGGNQQKVAIARLLHSRAKILLLDEPTRGIDVGSKQQIYQLIGELAAQGKAVLFVSSYLPELLGVCDTIGVMSRGELVAMRQRSAWTEQEIMRYATGAEMLAQNES